MKGDLTRSTFDPKRHFSGVRMQQGRVQVDADWNEHEDIVRHRIEIEARDVIGESGAPYHDAGFAVTPAAGGLEIGAGRYYVNGVLCENEAATQVAAQGDLPTTPLPATAGTYIAYLDVWTRHLTALDDALIREAALGGPDTATRTKTVWQVRLLPVADANFNCSSPLAAWDDLTKAPTARLRAQAQQQAAAPNICVVAPGAGFRRLENQLYRVEIHNPGGVGVATFKWSRDNGSVVAKWVDKQGDDLIVEQGPRDSYLRFAAGQWVELMHDDNELKGLPGTLVKLRSVDGDVLTIEPATATGSVTFADFPRAPKVRRWDSAGATIVSVPGGGAYLPLEDGVEVRFDGNTSYMTGQYWQIPARVANADVEWPNDGANPVANPVATPPAGIVHNYCRLAVLRLDNAGVWNLVGDCRRIFPPITELVALYYVGGDGQEVTPDASLPLAHLPLAQPLRVGVSNGLHPVPDARVRFTVTVGAGLVAGVAGSGIVKTGANGVASCVWSLDATTANQQVRAELLDDADQPVHLPIFFNANLSLASAVAYDPKGCANLLGARTVQEALDKLCVLPRGGSCCVVVGAGGEFPTLEAALDALLVQQKRRDICICLLGGDHAVAKELVLAGNPDFHVHLHGCGGATRLLLRGGRIRAQNLGSFSLEGLTITVADAPTDSPIVIDGCEDVRIVDCTIAQMMAKTTLLSIAGAARIAIRGAEIESSYHTRLKILDIPELLPKEAAGMLARELEVALAQSLSTTPKLFNEFGKRYLAFARQLPNRTGESLVVALRALQEALNMEPGEGRFVAVSAALADFFLPNAVAITGRPTVVIISDSAITGAVSLYGDTAPFTTDAFFALAQRFEGVQFGDGDVRLTGNHLSRVVVDQSIQRTIVNGTIRGAFARWSLSDNVFHSPYSQWVAGQVSAMGNQFWTSETSPVAMSASQALILVGNVSTPLFARLLYRVHGGFMESANLVKPQQV